MLFKAPNNLYQVALEQLSSMHKINIKNCGLFRDEKYPFLGATPNGITTSDNVSGYKMSYCTI